MIFSSVGAAYGTAKVCFGTSAVVMGGWTYEWVCANIQTGWNIVRLPLLPSNTLDSLDITRRPIPIWSYQLTSTSHNSIAGVGTFKPELIMKSLISVIMAGIIAVYGLVIAVLIAGDMSPEKEYTLFAGIMHLAAGLSVGLAGTAAGYAIGTVGNAGARAFLQQPKVFVGKVLILIFAEVLGLYGLIVA